LQGRVGAQYRASRRPGVSGRLAFFRARLDDEGAGTSIRLRSKRLADALAEALNAGVDVGGHPSRSPTPRYSATRGWKPRGETLVVAVERTVRDGSRYGDGVLGATRDDDLARRVVDALNQLDPAVFKPPSTWRGWFG